MILTHGPCIPFRYGPPWSTYSIYHYDGDPVLSPPVRYCVTLADANGDEHVVTTFPYAGERDRAIIEAAKEALAKVGR